MINLDAIHKDNIKNEPFEHLLLDFVDPKYIKSVYDEYIEHLETFNVCEYTNMVSVGRHPVQEILEEYKDEIIQKVNKLWNLDVVSISMGTNMFKGDSELDIHNDYNYDGNFYIPARGILYLNKDKVFGTHLHKDEDQPGIEVGGNPGQLLLFKVSENSWHSAGVNTNLDYRFTSNWLLNREGSPHQ
jgi:hypothetical protein